MARPARVDMRWRNPWRLARFRLLGWYVRFTHGLLGKRAPVQTRPSRRRQATRRQGRAATTLRLEGDDALGGAPTILALESRRGAGATVRWPPDGWWPKYFP